MKNTILVIFIVLILASCSSAAQPTDDVMQTLPPDTVATSPAEQTMPANEPTQSPNPFAPVPGDANLSREQAFVQESSLLIRESFPPVSYTHLTLPTSDLV